MIMATVRLTALSGVKRIKLELLAENKAAAAMEIEKGEQIFPALDEILKRSRIERTNVEDIFVACENDTSFLSCQMIEAARDIFLFARSVGSPKATVNK